MLVLTSNGPGPQKRLSIIYIDASSKRGEDEPRTFSAEGRGDDDRGAEGDCDQGVVCLAAVHDRLLAIQKARRSQGSDCEEEEGRDEDQTEVEGRKAEGRTKTYLTSILLLACYACILLLI